MINNNKKASNPSTSQQQQQCFWHQNLKSGCAFYLEKKVLPYKLNTYVLVPECYHLLQPPSKRSFFSKTEQLLIISLYHLLHIYTYLDTIVFLTFLKDKFVFNYCFCLLCLLQYEKSIFQIITLKRNKTSVICQSLKLTLNPKCLN